MRRKIVFAPSIHIVVYTQKPTSGIIQSLTPQNRYIYSGFCISEPALSPPARRISPSIGPLPPKPTMTHLLESLAGCNSGRTFARFFWDNSQAAKPLRGGARTCDIEKARDFRGLEKCSYPLIRKRFSHLWLSPPLCRRKNAPPPGSWNRL